MICGHPCCSFTHTIDQEMVRQAMLNLKRFRKNVEMDGPFYPQQWESMKKKLQPLEELMIPEKSGDEERPSKTLNIITLLHQKIAVAKSTKYIRDYVHRAISACNEFNRDKFNYEQFKRDQKAIPWGKKTKAPPPGFHEDDKLPMPSVCDIKLPVLDNLRMIGIKEELQKLQEEHESLKKKMIEVEARNKTLSNALNSVQYIVKGAFNENII